MRTYLHYPHKIIRTLLPFLITILLVQNDAWSQQTNNPIQDWEVGAFAGAGFISGDLVPDFNGILSTAKPAFGLQIQRNFNPNFALKGTLSYTQLASDDQNADNQQNILRGFSHKTNIYELATLAQWEFLGHLRHKEPGEFNKIISPYLFGGLGLAFGAANTDYRDVQSLAVENDQIASRDYRLIVPFGGGLKLDLNRNLSIALEVGLRASLTDHLDGVSQTGNPNKNDWYAFSGISISYRLGETDYDGDGIVDLKDACPGIAGDLSFGRGCPDSDGDFVVDAEDECPLLPGKRVFNGCPDSDQDGVVDTKDECPEVKGMFRFMGCPDTDHDEIIDKEDDCPTLAGSLAMSGCPDADMDGIADKDDHCPDLAGLKNLQGCPDTDGDGIADNLDSCPNLKGKIDGCPDLDGDFVADKDDHCPEVAGNIGNHGCPSVNVKDVETLNVLAKNINFAPNLYKLNEPGRLELTRVARILRDYPDYQLLIKGYTDNLGDNDLNKSISEKRARSCYEYLAKMGVPKTRMFYVGYGIENPISDNNSEEGRILNRRVEFELVKDVAFE